MSLNIYAFTFRVLNIWIYKAKSTRYYIVIVIYVCKCKF